MDTPDEATYRGGLFKTGPKVYHKVRIEFEVIAPDGTIQHKGFYDLNDHIERRAFAIRIHDALNEGYEIHSRKSKTQNSEAIK